MIPDALSRLVHLLARLPGVGEKTAQRFALHLIGDGGDLAPRLGAELVSLMERIRPCERCGNIAEVDDAGHAECGVCRDPRRDNKLLCVVARVQDLLAVERSGAMRGRYFVLGKLLSPLDGVGPDDLPLGELGRRIEQDGVEELIVATPPSVDGEATALLLSRELGARVRLSRIASGVPHGGDLEFADMITLGRAIDGRRKLD
ncbi:MAG: recombination protein RecR [Polyangiaceae bacterium]|nr:recombination protein RecR [Myxococcales bacterium]MCB9584300.1 recombination protein RecR [Polyangiaceae bacterium]